MIEVRHLKLMRAFSKNGSLSGAAKELHLTQSALSHQLKQLEELLGTEVFHRVNNHLTLTRIGEQLVESSFHILGEFDEMQGKLSNLQNPEHQDYIHGYSDSESRRLNDQASSIADVIHWDSIWEEGSRILEVGCGVGAQTKIIAKQNPKCSFHSIDISRSSLDLARQVGEKEGLSNVKFEQADAASLSFKNESFDHVFVCFVLEHLINPLDVLCELLRVLKKGGSITLVEGDHGSTYFHPDSKYARQAIQAQVSLQIDKGGNPNIGRELNPLLAKSGFNNIAVSPRQIYADSSKPMLAESFIKNTFTSMIQGVANEAISKNLITKTEMQRGINDLLRTADFGGTFCYTFFKGIGYKS